MTHKSSKIGSIQLLLLHLYQISTMFSHQRMYIFKKFKVIEEKLDLMEKMDCIFEIRDLNSTQITLKL